MSGQTRRLGKPGAEHNPAYFSARDFTHLTDAGYALVGKDAAQAVETLPPASVPAPTPRLTFQNPVVQNKLGAAYAGGAEEPAASQTRCRTSCTPTTPAGCCPATPPSLSARAAATTSPGPAMRRSIAGTPRHFWSRKRRGIRSGPSASAMTAGR